MTIRICRPSASTRNAAPARPEGSEVSYDNKKRENFFRFDALVVMDYDQTSGTCRLLRSLDGDPLARGYETDAERYRPANRIVERPWTLEQRRLLLQRVH
jgi:hypothetical protein